MRAVTYEEFGPAPKVLTMKDLPDPTPNPGEVVVDLVYSGVNPSDVKARAGARPGQTRPPFPLIVPHSDGAGVIRAVGAGVSKDRIGQAVWIWNGQWQRPFGTAASQIAVPSQQAVALTEGTSMQTGACLGIPGLTACHAVFGQGDVSGQTILVQGGAGTVGLLAVQLARWGGARVIATARGRGADEARAAGAHEVVDYSTEDLSDQILDANDGAPVDRVIEVEFGLNIACDAKVIAPNGIIAAYGSAKQPAPTLPFMELMFKAVTLDAILIYLLPDDQRGKAIARLNDALAAGALNIPVDTIFGMDDCAAAHCAVEDGGRSGAILVDVSE